MKAPCFLDYLLPSLDGPLQFTVAQMSDRADGVALRACAGVAWQAERNRLLSCVFGLA
jgi:hypothetical protein